MELHFGTQTSGGRMKRYWEGLRPFEKRVVAGVATGLFVIFNLWFIIPHFADLGRMKTRMKNAEWTLRLRETAIAQKPYYDEEIKKLQREGLDVPAEEQALQFQRTVSDEEMRVGVNPISTGRIITRTNEFFSEQTQTINVQSSEQPLVDFLFNLGSGNSLIRVRDLVLHPDPQTRQQLAGAIKLVASYQKNPSKSAVPGARTGSTRTSSPTSRSTTAASPSSSPPPQPGKKTAP